MSTSVWVLFDTTADKLPNVNVPRADLLIELADDKHTRTASPLQHPPTGNDQDC